ncbi:MAG: FtsX-like permease family protein, partial [Bacteroidales bacterium]|nr:FtsX-like permease family protein [Bacteroidales bacterium]
MLSTNIKLALRNLNRYKTYSILNILGLAVGLALGIFVIIDISYSFGYDRFHSNWDRMYKLLAFIEQGEGKSFTNYQQSILTGEALKQEASEIESYNRHIYTSLYFKKDGFPFQESGIYSDENFFTTFNFGLLQGNATEILKQPDQIAVSERLAEKLFGDKPSIGQWVSVFVDNKQETFKISGIFKNVEHSNINFEFVLPLSFFISRNAWANSLNTASCEYVFTLKQNADVNQVNKKIRNYFQGKDNTVNKELFMQPLWEVKLYYYMNGQKHMNQLLIVLITGIIGGLILLISVFNFINMAIAMGIKRNKEAGIKKILGSTKLQIIAQFLTESIVISLIALFFAFIIAETFLPFFNNSAYVNLEIEYSNIGQMLLYIGFAVITGVIASLYPAFRFASASPVKVLKGISGNRQKIGFSRQGLIVFQFTITLLLTNWFIC